MANQTCGRAARKKIQAWEYAKESKRRIRGVTIFVGLLVGGNQPVCKEKDRGCNPPDNLDKYAERANRRPTENALAKDI